MVAIAILMFADFPRLASRDVEVPRGGASPTSEEPAVLVEIGPDGATRVDGENLDGDLVPAIRRRADSGAVIWVAADSVAPTGITLRAYALLEDAHFTVHAVFREEVTHENPR